MTEYGDVIGVTSIAHKIKLEFSSHPDIQAITSKDKMDPERVVMALRMVDGTTVTIAIQSNYDPAKDPYII